MEEDADEDSIVNTNTSSSHVQRSIEYSHDCKICGASAEHSNYGLMTCSPCKMFFKRNAITGQVSQDNFHEFYIINTYCLC